MPSLRQSGEQEFATGGTVTHPIALETCLALLANAGTFC